MSRTPECVKSISARGRCWSGCGVSTASFRALPVAAVEKGLSFLWFNWARNHFRCNTRADAAATASNHPKSSTSLRVHAYSLSPLYQSVFLALVGIRSIIIYLSCLSPFLSFIVYRTSTLSLKKTTKIPVLAYVCMYICIHSPERALHSSRCRLLPLSSMDSWCIRCIRHD